jgi:hypothetical protein
MRVMHTILTFGLSLTSLGLLAQEGRTLEVPAAESGVVAPLAPIDTRDFFPQIRVSMSQRAIRPANPQPQRSIPIGVPNSLEAPVASNATAGSPGAQFPGITANGFDPPDPSIAVGPGHVVQVVNGEIAYFTKAGTQVFQQTLDHRGFFNGVAQTTFVFDPKVFYDQISNRFFLVALEFRQNPQNSALLVAVSDNNNPIGVWFRYRIDARTSRNGTFYWFDYPGFGYNKDGLVITGNMFRFTGSGGEFARSYAFRKAGFLTGTTVTFFTFNHDDVFTIQPARTLDTNPRVFGTAIRNSSSIQVQAWSGLAGTPSLRTTNVTVPTFMQFTGRVPTLNNATLDPVADRMMDSAFRAGLLNSVHTIRHSQAVNRAIVRWYEFAVNAWPASGSVTLRQRGSVVGPSNTHVFMPAVSRLANGGMSIVMTQASATMGPRFIRASRKGTDALHTIGAIQTIAGSTRGPAVLNSRWGDYLSVASDPSSPTTLWGVGQLVQPNGNWRTEIVSWTIP